MTVSARAGGLAIAVILSVLCIAALGMNRLAVGLVIPATALLLWSGLSRPPSTAVLKATTLFVAIGLGIALADVGLRLLMADPPGGRPEGRFGLRWPADPRLTKMLAEQRFEGEVFGDLARMSGIPAHRWPRTTSFVTDRLGFRNNVFPDATVDLIVLGDSFGLGAGTTQTETLDAHLARLGKHRAYNLSYIGSPWHELVRLKSELPHLPVRPGTVVLWLLFSGNDLTERYRPALEVTAPRGAILRTLTRYEAFRRRSPVRGMVRSIFKKPASVIERVAPDGRRFLFYGPYASRLSWTAEEVRNHRNFPRLREVVAEMKRFCAQQQLTLAIAVAPTKSEVYHWILEEGSGPPPAAFACAVTDLCTAQGIPSLDLTPLFRAEAKRLDAAAGEFLWWHDDSHWNGRGHAFAARCIQERLLKK